jgi:hypothetical protein
MRFKFKCRDYLNCHNWHPWFAWRPVVVDCTVVWWEWVDRKITYEWIGITMIKKKTYRFPKDFS